MARHRSSADIIVSAQRTISRRVLRGESFESIEGLVESIEGINEEQRSALWLYAWALQPRTVLARETRRTFALVATD
jgi:hypothetical protein